MSGFLTSFLDRLGSAQLVTGSALLDLLTIDQLDAIGSALAVAPQPGPDQPDGDRCLGTVAAPTLRLAPDSGIHFLDCVKPAAYQPVRPTDSMSAPPRTGRAWFPLSKHPTVDGHGRSQPADGVQHRIQQRPRWLRCPCWSTAVHVGANKASCATSAEFGTRLLSDL
jgi:hypothetical protein